ncbi:FABP family protein [Janibacter alkaliphilus]|uniref:Peroxynitrite isomerase n=1 Tax=Janibacter alkaliphilus TaxID=1069963 RepID=A0A852X3A7_9MICO|nr:hypothetical protein [Janibacter alkaliphilus]
MFTIDPTLHPDIAPLAWLVGRWEGAGVVGYPTMESANFGQEVFVTHDGRPFLTWLSQTWLLDEQGEKTEPYATETGYWRAAGEGEVELLLAHPTGIVEMYYGSVEPARVELKTDGVIRSSGAADYSAAQRMYGYVNSNLMWVMDMAAEGHPMTSHMSAELKRVE